jgi:hypothetical protein
MGDDIECPIANQIRELWRGHTDLVKSRLRRDILTPSSGQVVDHDSLEPLGDKEIGDV